MNKLVKMLRRSWIINVKDNKQYLCSNWGGFTAHCLVSCYGYCDRLYKCFGVAWVAVEFFWKCFVFLTMCLMFFLYNSCVVSTLIYSFFVWLYLIHSLTCGKCGTPLDSSRSHEINYEVVINLASFMKILWVSSI